MAWHHIWHVIAPHTTAKSRTAKPRNHAIKRHAMSFFKYHKLQTSYIITNKKSNYGDLDLQG